jgi:hypothetical protein
VGITVEVAASTQPAGELLTTDEYSQDDAGPDEITALSG